MDRKDFLKLSAAGLGAAALGGQGCASVPDGFYGGLPKGARGKPERVIIIGAGIAGLAAARALKQAGVETVVLEARNRIGGRMDTRLLGGRPIDFGAAWVDGGPANPLHGICARLGLEVLDKPYVDPFNVMGYDAARGDWISSLSFIYQYLRSSGFDIPRAKTAGMENMEAILKRRLDARNLEGFDRHARDFIIRTSIELNTGESLRNLPGWNGEPPSEIGGSQYMITGGYIRLVRAFARGLDIRLNRTVGEIAAVGDGVRVRTSKGDFTGSHVIVTLPLGVLKKNKIAFAPDLPDYKRRAIENLAMGKLEKVIMCFPRAFWREGAETQNFYYLSKSPGEFPFFVDASPDAKQPALAALIAGDFSAKFIGRSGPEASYRAMEKILKRIFSKTYIDPTHRARSAWQRDPFAGGAYSCPTGSSTGIDHERLAEPVAGRILFAGEATSRAYNGFVHGAMATGIREARRLTGRAIVPVF